MGNCIDVFVIPGCHQRIIEKNLESIFRIASVHYATQEQLNIQKIPSPFDRQSSNPQWILVVPHNYKEEVVIAILNDLKIEWKRMEMKRMEIQKYLHVPDTHFGVGFVRVTFDEG